MKFNRTTISLVILALGLTGFVYFSEIKDQGLDISSKLEQSSEKKPKIFNFDPKNLKNIKIDLNNQKIEFEKTDSWQMIQPEKFKANDAAISFLINLFPEAENHLDSPIEDDRAIEYGINETSSRLQWTLSNDENYEMILGKSNFNDTQIYALIKFPPSVKSKSGIFLVSKSFQYAIERDFNEWKAE